MNRLVLVMVLLVGGCGATTGRPKPDDSCLDIAHDCAVFEWTIERLGEKLDQVSPDCEKAAKCKQGRKP